MDKWKPIKDAPLDKDILAGFMLGDANLSRLNSETHLGIDVYFGDPRGNRTPVTAVKGRCLNRLTKGPKTSDVLLSQGAAPQVSSALRNLTSVFGMGTGVAQVLSSLDKII